jgi:hypothetical protein
LPNLFSCQSSSSLDLSSKSRLSGFGLLYRTFDIASEVSISNPMFGVKTTFIGPRTDSRLSHLTPNIGLIGGADRDRTGGLLVANQALSQLSYSPLFSLQPSALSHQVKQIILRADD